jgi:nucleoside-diphosphate-sugar epimerase
MKIFFAGATGVVGRRLIPLLVAGGHDVIATTRTPDKIATLRAGGADALLLDGLDKDAVMKAVASSRPDVIVHQMTALASIRNLRKFDEEFALTNRLRTEGTENLLAAARVAGTRKLVAQSYTGWTNERRGGRIKTEDDPLDSNPPKAMAKTLGAIRTLENMVLKASGITGIVLRYGNFYGPGTSLSQDGEIVNMIRHRKFPLVGDGAGVWSFIHIDDAARATQLAVERGTSGIYNIVDDDPAELSVWLPDLAQAIGAKPPHHVPAWLGRLVMGEAVLSMMTKARGSSNTKAKRALTWQPVYSSWRDGFRHSLSPEPLRNSYLKAV